MQPEPGIIAYRGSYVAKMLQGIFPQLMAIVENARESMVMPHDMKKARRAGLYLVFSMVWRQDSADCQRI
jgi:hypothetical protein